MPIHKVKKNVKRYYKDGRYVESSELNAYKYETLALDLIHMMDSCLAFEIEREKEFAPIKNKEGKDSLDTARELLKMNGWELLEKYDRCLTVRKNRGKLACNGWIVYM